MGCVFVLGHLVFGIDNDLPAMIRILQTAYIFFIFAVQEEMMPEIFMKKIIWKATWICMR